jgi:hypothetical protein
MIKVKRIRLFSLLILVFCSVILTAQNTFVKIIDLDSLPQYAKQILRVKNKYYLSVFNSCGSYVCDGVIEISKDGNIIKETKINNLSNNFKSLTFDSTNNLILYSGEIVKPDFPDDHFLLCRIDPNNLNLKDSFFIRDQTRPFVKMFQSGLVSLGTETLISGIGRDAENSPAKSLIYVLNHDYTIDTLLTFQFTRGNTNIWEQYVDHDGLLTFHFWYDNFDIYEFRSRIIKINEDKEVVWDWVSPPIKKSIFPYGTQHSDGFTLVCLPEWNHQSNVNLVAVNKDGTTRWSHFYPDPKIYKKREARRVKELKNGDILVMGLYEDRELTPRVYQSPYMCRISKEGKLLWERAYYTDYGGSQVSTGYIYDMIEHDDGRIMAVGQIREGNVPPYTDILILTTDADGCITPGCGVLNKLNDLISETEEVDILDKIELTISPNPIHDVIQLQWEKNRSEDIMIRIFDATGEIKYIGKGFDGHIEIDAKNWTAGMYIIQYQTQKGIIQYQKMIKL